MSDVAEDLCPDVAHACVARTRLCTLVAHAFNVPCRHRAPAPTRQARAPAKHVATNGDTARREACATIRSRWHWTKGSPERDT